MLHHRATAFAAHPLERSARLFGSAIVLALLMALAGPAPLARAQDENRAGLVIVRGDGTVTRQCVAFPEATISGYELLKRAGLVLSVEAAASGATICSIEGEGCTFPEESCFCRCQGSPCVYWSYWRMTADGWLYQVLGAGNTKVGNGDVEGWHWAAGTTRDAQAPPDATFAEICTAETGAMEAGATGGKDAGEAADEDVEMVEDSGTVEQPPAPTPALARELPSPAGSASVQAPAVPATAIIGGFFLLLAIVVVPAVGLAAFALWRRRGVAP